MANSVPVGVGGLPAPAGSPEVPPLGSLASQMQQPHKTTKTMANVGYQESEYWTRPKHFVRAGVEFIADDLSSSTVIFPIEKQDITAATGLSAMVLPTEGSGGSVGFMTEGERVEYDMDEQGMCSSHRALLRA